MNIGNKILFIQFKFLGDIVFLTPIIKAYKNQFPNKEIHLLVSKEVAPLVSNLPYIYKVWPFPRVRGKFNFIESLKFIKQLRACNFDTSLDFVGNDRGAIISALIGAKLRVGALRQSSSFLQKFLFQLKVYTDSFPSSNILLNKSIIESGFNFKFKKNLPMMELKVSPPFMETAKHLIKGNFILCHVSSTQIKKQWAIKKWAELYNISKKLKTKLFFSAGPTNAEQSFLLELRKIVPNANILKPINDINLFIALLSRADLLIANDSGPLHFAAAMKINVIGLFGPADSVRRAAPIYSVEQKLLGKKCVCINELGKKHFCSVENRCIDFIKAKDVLCLINKQIKKPKICK